MSGSEVPDITLALPAYNEAYSIRRVVEEAARNLDAFSSKWEILVVDNDSKDETGAIVREMSNSDQRIRLITHETNRLYSGSCSTILNEATGRYIMIMDSDGQFTAEDIPKFMEKINEGYDFVMGWRKKREDPLARLLTTALFNLMGKYWLSYPYHDLNCGIRMFNRKYADGAKIKYGMNMANPELYVSAINTGCTVAEVEVHHFQRSGGETCHDFAKSLRLFFEVNKYMKSLSKEMS